MNVGEICSRIVVVAERSTPVQQAAKLMRDHHIGALVVTEGGAGAGKRRPV
jgi:CBS domain-containing protein